MKLVCRFLSFNPCLLCIPPRLQDGQPLVTSFPEAEAEIRRLKEELTLLRRQNGEGGDNDLIQEMESRESEKNNKSL